MSSTLSSTGSWFSARPTKTSEDATLVPGGQNVTADTKSDRFPITWPSLDKRTLLAIAFPITLCIGIAAGSVWQSSRVATASIPQAATAPTAPSSNLEQQLEAMSLGLAVVRQSLAELANGLGQVRNDIADLQKTEQALFDKISEPRPAAAPAPKPAPRPSQAPPPVR